MKEIFFFFLNLVERRWNKMETMIGICGLDRSQVQTGYVEGIVKIT